METPDASLSEDWRVWLAENRLLGQPEEALLAVTAREGLPEALVREELAALARHPALKAGLKLAQLVRRLESTLQLELLLSRLGPDPAIARRDALGADDFYREYYCANRPVVLTGLMKDWPALARWSPQDFKQRFGDAEIAISDGRSGDPDLLKHLDRYTRHLPMAAYVDRVLAADESDDFYMVATNRNLARPELAPLLDDIRHFPGYFNEARTDASHYLWFGPAGTRTPLHTDLHNIMFCQVTGRKRFFLISPRETALLYHSDGFTCTFDAEHPDFSTHPGLARVAIHTVELGPGEALFLPVGWWHQVRSLDVAISFTFTNFKLATEYAGLTEHLIADPLIERAP